MNWDPALPSSHRFQQFMVEINFCCWPWLYTQDVQHRSGLAVATQSLKQWFLTFLSHKRTGWHSVASIQLKGQTAEVDTRQTLRIIQLAWIAPCEFRQPLLTDSGEKNVIAAFQKGVRLCLGMSGVQRRRSLPKAGSEKCEPLHLHCFTEGTKACQSPK